MIKLEKISRFSIGAKIDNLFIETIENVFIASRKSGGQKLLSLNKASDVFDLLKFFLQIIWETGALDSKKYIVLSIQLNEIGRMLGGWQKQTETRERVSERK